jgi:hypothetical protein
MSGPATGLIVPFSQPTTRRTSPKKAEASRPTLVSSHDTRAASRPGHGPGMVEPLRCGYVRSLYGDRMAPRRPTVTPGIYGSRVWRAHHCTDHGAAQHQRPPPRHRPPSRQRVRSGDPLASATTPAPEHQQLIADTLPGFPLGTWEPETGVIRSAGGSHRNHSRLGRRSSRSLPDNSRFAATAFATAPTGLPGRNGSQRGKLTAARDRFAGSWDRSRPSVGSDPEVGIGPPRSSRSENLEVCLR